MELLLVIANSFFRPRHRCFYVQVCVLLLLLAAMAVYVYTASQSTVVPVTHGTLIGNTMRLTTENATTKCVAVGGGVKTPVKITNKPASKDTHHPTPTIFAITSTKRTLTQLLDLTSLCQTLMNVGNLMWIVVESFPKKSPLVSDVLSTCKVKSVHLNLPMMAPDVTVSSTIVLKRGAREKNKGLEWVRQYCLQEGNCTGVVYFMDDESKYDLRLFDLMREVKYVGVWPVAFAGEISFEGPVCVNGTNVEWHALPSAVRRPFPISSIGFAVNIHCVMDHPKAQFGYSPNSQSKSPRGFEESDFLRNFLKDGLNDKLECKGSDKEVYVWQVKSEINPYLRKHKYRWKYKLRT